MFKRLLTYGCFIFTLLLTNVEAAIELSDDVTLRGFGSTSATKGSSETPVFINREITDDVCFDCDTTFGLQLDYVVTDDFTTSLQVVKRPQDEWSDPEVEWLYASYTYSDIETKIGRLRLPLFLVSEYYYVAQAYTWARAPQEVYNSVLGVTSFNGMSVTWNHQVSDDVILAVSPYYGVHDSNKISSGDRVYHFTTNDVKGIYMDIIGFNYRIHSNVMASNYDYNVKMKEESLAKEADKNMVLYSLGAEYSLNAWHAMAEIQTNDMQTNWYASLAYTLNKFTPYVIYSESHRWKENYSVTSGMRYDLTTKVSINAEWQIMELTKNSEQNTGQFTKYEGSNSSNISTVIINFIF